MEMDVLEEPGKKVVLLGNEAVVRGALEAGVGFAAAYPGTPSSEVPLTFSMIAKKVGIYFEYAYTGVRAGLVVMVADDPYGWSSAQSEQDTRYYARMFKVPMIEPSNPQECLDYTKLAFDISEEFHVPVFLRTTTKVSHSIGNVMLGELKKPEIRGRFQKDPDKYYNIRS
jgi:indolepyruvate ferredoxin oxidoreductase alpha subunit